MFLQLLDHVQFSLTSFHPQNSAQLPAILTAERLRFRRVLVRFGRLLAGTSSGSSGSSDAVFGIGPAAWKVETLEMIKQQKPRD